MSKFARVKNVVFGILTVFVGLMLMLAPEDGFYVIVMILSIGLLIAGIKEIVFYFSMAINMVGGKRSFYKGIIILEAAIFTISLYDIPKFFIMLYLIGIHGFSGVVEIMRAVEAKKNGSSFTLKLIQGSLDIIMALCCAVFIKNGNIGTYIYSVGLINSAIFRIVSSFKKTAIVYIQ